MVISHTQSLLLLLVGSLCFSPALCHTYFITCLPGNLYPVNVTDVKINPDAVNTDGDITITGSTNKRISDGVNVYVGLTKSVVDMISYEIYALCKMTPCPIEPGPILLKLSNIFTAQQKRSGFGYHVLIRIIDPMNQTQDEMCIEFSVEVNPPEFSIPPIVGY